MTKTNSRMPTTNLRPQSNVKPASSPSSMPTTNTKPTLTVSMNSLQPESSNRFTQKAFDSIRGK